MRNTYEITEVVFRSGEPTCAVVRAEVSSANIAHSDNALFKTIRNAVDAWAMMSDAGKEALERASYDFNVGDLHRELQCHFAQAATDSANLEFHLAERGIMALSVDCVAGGGRQCAWTYDTHLFTVSDDDVLDAADARNA